MKIAGCLVLVLILTLFTVYIYVNECILAIYSRCIYSFSSFNSLCVDWRGTRFVHHTQLVRILYWKRVLMLTNLNGLNCCLSVCERNTNYSFLFLCVFSC